MNLNNNGKAFILLILIPVFIIISLIIADTLISYRINNKFKKDTEIIIKDVINRDDLGYEEYYDAMKREYERKGYDTDMLLVQANSYEVYVENEHNYFGLFTSLRNKTNKEGKIKIFGIVFKVRKNSKAFIKVTAKNNYDGKLEFTYEK